MEEEKPPVMEYDQFYEAFMNLFEDEDELNEAVNFLNTQG